MSAPPKELPVLITGPRAPVWWAMFVLIAIETTVFATLLSSYFYLRFRAPEWPPAGVPPPDLLLPIINTGVLFASGVAVLWGTTGIRHGNVRRLQIGFGVGIVLEVVFLTIKQIVAGGLDYGWSSHAFGSVFLTIDRFHSAHVLVAILIAIVAEVLAFKGFFTAERRLGVQAVNIYWQFVAIVWVPVFVVLFLVPRWF